MYKVSKMQKQVHEVQWMVTYNSCVYELYFMLVFMVSMYERWSSIC